MSTTSKEPKKNSLTKDGFFKTGDIAKKVGNLFFIKGRKSVYSKVAPSSRRSGGGGGSLLTFSQVIKLGGYKISALDVEREILNHRKAHEAIVVGTEDPEYGQRIAAAVVLKEVRVNMNEYFKREGV